MDTDTAVDNLIIDRLGGTGAAADLFGIAPASVSEWKRKGIPKARLQSLLLRLIEQAKSEQSATA